MKLISMFEENGVTFVKDENGNLYSLKLIKKTKLTPLEQSSPLCDDLALIEKIENMLSDLQIPSGYSGYNLLTHCLYFSISSEKCRERLSVNLYPKVARIYNMAAGSIPPTLTTIICRWGRTSKYKDFYRQKTVSAKQLILDLTNYYLTHY